MKYLLICLFLLGCHQTRIIRHSSSTSETPASPQVVVCEQNNEELSRQIEELKQMQAEIYNSLIEDVKETLDNLDIKVVSNIDISNDGSVDSRANANNDLDNKNDNKSNASNRNDIENQLKQLDKTINKLCQHLKTVVNDNDNILLGNCVKPQPEPEPQPEPNVCKEEFKECKTLCREEYKECKSD
jgi:hypothetical protein